MCEYISDTVNSPDKFVLGKFNLIASGTGTGKTEFVRRKLIDIMKEKLGDIEPAQIMYVTSRSMIRDQQSMESGIERYHGYSAVKDYWNDMREIQAIDNLGIWILNLNQLIQILDDNDIPASQMLRNVKVAVFDECHAICADTFIDNLGMIRLWIKERLRDESMYIIGMTATPNILREKYLSDSCINLINDEFVVKYKVKNLIVSNTHHAEELLTKFDGKTIVLCESAEACNMWHSKYKNSIVLMSRGNCKYTKEIEENRNYIIEHSTLPDYTEDPDTGELLPVKYMFATTTTREGINLRDISGIRNVICFLADEINIKQFVGRCRFNVENLIVIYKYVHLRTYDNRKYMKESTEKFREYIHNSASSKWYDSLVDILDCGFKDIVRYKLDMGGEIFQDVLDQKYLNIWLSKNEHELIIEDAKKSCIFGTKYKPYTFAAVIKFIQNNMGYKIEKTRVMEHGVRDTLVRITKNREEDETLESE